MISNAAGERAAAGRGPSRGWKMDSYRAECSGMFSLLRFLIRLGEYTFHTEKWVGTIGTDSQSMLDTLFGSKKVWDGEQLTAEKFQELDVMVAEWDLLREIQESLRFLPEVTLKYVKGHQDAQRAYARLSLLAQLNVDADDNAKKYQQQYGKAHPFVLMSPHAGAFVTIPEGTIAAKVVPELRRHSTGLSLRFHIQQRNQWTDRIMSIINWKAHGKALNGMSAQRVHFTKLVHDILPTYHRLNQLTKGERKCPACQRADETRDHVLRCPNAERSRWRITFMAKMEDFHQKENTSPLLRSVWREAMALWFLADKTQQDVQLSPFLFPMDARQVIMHQNAIGWRQIFNGRFAKAWATVQDDFLARQAPNENENPRRDQKGKQWQKKFIIEIWKHWMIVWKSCNDMVHGKNLATQREATRRRTEAELRDIYNRREQLESEFQPLLYGDIQEHIQRHHPGTTRNWIETNAPIFRESLRWAKRRAITGVRSIRSYFAPVR
jgi:hypothetical protein